MSIKNNSKTKLKIFIKRNFDEIFYLSALFLVSTILLITIVFNYSSIIFGYLLSGLMIYLWNKYNKLFYDVFFQKVNFKYSKWVKIMIFLFLKKALVFITLGALIYFIVTIDVNAVINSEISGNKVIKFMHPINIFAFIVGIIINMFIYFLALYLHAKKNSK
ncbi:hypothetical protein ACJOMT_00340 [Mycoplasmopsis synoviae]|uniref:hypothetical protein n=1 Tax=Mycoplasmopsis synoviae TaxID=2109 RepID=UPI000CA28B23|nr:hypothetical protein [Mycoplasmopsis synoviae]AKJ20634.1 hypothetical protein MSHv_01570 [Mycoplasmopsis synoviae]AQU47954.1 hypothetical protein ADF19_01570 [Mycoplasmopsis synoviae]AWL84201.1 hypothetical protein MSH_02090 [Mycoplasmopsis synoviae]QLE13921.1 hypothetical protein DEH79_02085 [Mycoplasmopsis synoviae]UZF64048.1 hypothetical protein N0B76_02105 [Mycoplasmopsis synoviae]